MLCQGERAILETTFRYPGDFMFHAHQSEFAELGWMGLFRAEAGVTPESAVSRWHRRRRGAPCRRADDRHALAAALIAPLVMVASLLAWIVTSRPGRAVRGNELPPVERLTFQRVALEPGAIVATVLNDGPDRVDHRAGPGRRCVLDVHDAIAVSRSAISDATTLRIPYPWVEGEAHHGARAHVDRRAVRARDSGGGGDTDGEHPPDSWQRSR